MHIAVRSSIATGVALVGASAIALTPIQPVTSPLFNVPAAVSTASVDLTAAYNPFAAWVNLFTTSATNVGEIGSEWLADPAPVVRQIGTNMIGYGTTLATAMGGAADGLYTYLTDTVPTALKKAAGEMADGQWSEAGATLEFMVASVLFTVGLPLFPLLDVPKDIVGNLNAAVNSVLDIGTMFALVGAVMGPINGTIQATFDGIQVVADAVAGNDVPAAIGALLDIVPNTINVFMNGGTLSSGSYPGILQPEAPGLLYTLGVFLPRTIAVALGAAPAAPPAAAKQAASASAAQAPAPSPKASGVAQSKRAIAPTDANDGNKVEPETIAAPSAAASSKKAVAAKSGAAKSTAGSSGSKGHSARR